jgi:hypothetical protein
MLTQGEIYPLPKANLAFGIIQADSRFRYWAGGFIGLSIWDAPNRLTLRQAAETILAHGMDNFTLDQFKAELEETVTYPYKKSGLSVVLNNLGYNYVTERQLWCKASD